jgi:hypothetical protein
MTATSKLAIPDLTSAQVEHLLVGLADILIKLDGAGRIISVIDNAAITNGAETGWIGKMLPAVVSPESVSKTEKLIDPQTLSEGPKPWRHINLVTASGGMIPLLVKHFCLNAGPVELYLLAGRDLRPLQQIQAKFQAATAELERRSDRRAGKTDFATLLGGANILGTKSIDDIVKEAADMVQQAFFAEAMRHAGGDPEKAAQLLGLSTSEFLRRALANRLN